jgi:hypothetical protein
MNLELQQGLQNDPNLFLCCSDQTVFVRLLQERDSQLPQFFVTIKRDYRYNAPVPTRTDWWICSKHMGIHGHTDRKGFALSFAYGRETDAPAGSSSTSLAFWPTVPDHLAIPTKDFPDVTSITGSIYKCPSLASNLSQFSPVHNVAHYFPIIRSSAPWSPNCFLPLRFSDFLASFVFNSHLYMRAACPVLLISLDLLSIIILSNEYKFWISTLCPLLLSPSYFQIFTSTLRCETPKMK